MASAARASSERAVEQRKRRKIPLACEPCRERKSRCDGAKPICSTCQRRSLPIHHCVYTLENARTASSEAYIKVLHDRIRRLEKTCTDHGIPIPPLDSGDGSEGEIPGPGPSPLSPVLPGPIPGPGSGPSLGPRRPTDPNLTIPSPPVQTHHHHHTSSSPNTTLRPPPIPVVASPERERFDVTESTASVTAMGTVTAEHDVPQTFDAANEFYGSSSAASFMKEAYTSVKPHRPRNASTGTGTTSTAAGNGTLSNGPQPFLAPFARSEPHTFTQFAQVDKFALPPRNLADHLLSRFWERVYWLYPLFDKPTFLHAYETLWRPAHEQQQPKPSNPHQPQNPSNTPLPGLGLGSTPGADAHTIVFHCSLNTIFALGAQFSDLSLPDKAAAIETFFNRAKAFVGLDFIDMHNVGVVQSLLLMALLLQSTPFPNRCWNAVGLACRVAQGLGLHTEDCRGDRGAGSTGGGGSEGEGRPGLEMEVRRRTWHGCVILDMIVSMTYGRPTMTAHLPDIPFPSTIAEPGSSPSSSTDRGPSEMCFYIEYIRQCRILGEILSHVYQPSAGAQQPPQTQNPHQQHQQHGLGLGQGMGGQGQQSWFGRETHGMDAILGLDAKLTRYETELPAIMSWKAPCDISGLDAERKLIIATQRTVLRGSFLYLRLMLHRPILTQLCANTEATSSPTNQTTTAGASTGSGPGTGTEAPSSPLLLRTGSAAVSAGRELFTSFAAGCAKICLGAAVDLIELVHSTYLTNTSGGWWWDGLYAFTAGLAVIVGYLSPSLLASMDKQRLERSWMRCQEILAHFTSFSVSAQRSLRLLQKVHGDVMSRCSDQELPLGLPAMSAGPIGPGEAAMAGQQAGFHMNPEDMPLDLGSGFQWQMPGSDMMGAGLVFNWDQSLDMISGGLGMDLYP